MSSGNVTTTVTSAPSASSANFALLRELMGTTPGRLRLLLGAIVVLSAAACWAGITAVREFRADVETIGVSSAPSIEAAAQIRADLADMDANAANGFFSSGTREARKQYESDCTDLAARLVIAAKNITYGDSEQTPLQQIVHGVPVYTGLVERARTLGYPAGLVPLHEASDLLRGRLLPAVEALDRANLDPLQHKYSTAGADVSSYSAVFWLATLLLAAALVGAQLFLLRKMRRVFNIPLVLAFAGLVVLAGLFFSISDRAFAALKLAKEDAFDSMHALWKAKAVAFLANADESFYLLEPKMQQAYERHFREQSALVADRNLDAALLRQITAESTEKSKVSLGGFLGAEINNITFAGERELALSTINQYAKYMAVDQEIRRLETSGRHSDAVTLCTGNAPDQSNGAFDRFTSSLQSLADLNKTEFNAAVQNSLTTLAALPWIVGSACLLTAGLSALGLSLRIREYAG